jgi:hypothetical protein
MQNNKIMFKGRKLLIATKHEKEKVIAPILEKELGVSCFVINDFDVDISKKEGLWFQEMLVIAIEKILKEQSKGKI